MPDLTEWTIGRIATTVAVIAVAVPAVLIAIEHELPLNCDMTPEWNSVAVGLAYLGVWCLCKVLKRVNDALERALAAYHAARSKKSPFREL